MLGLPALRNSKSLWSYNPIPRGCVLYLPLWSPGLSGPVFKSIDPYGHTCTVTGATWGTTGRTFAGAEDIDCGSATSLDISGAFTVEVWGTAGALNETFAAKHTSSSTPGTGFYLMCADTTVVSFKFFQADGELKTANVSFVVDTFYHLVGVYNGSNSIVAYSNGSAGTPTAVVGYAPANAQSLMLGRYSYAAGIYLNGIIGEVRLYNRALSAGEVLHNYNKTKEKYL